MTDLITAQLDKFEDALINGDIETIVADHLPMLDRLHCWRRAMRRVARIKPDLPAALRRYFVFDVWPYHGGHIRLEVGNDLVLLDALRKLLLPYRGTSKLLYRSETLRNQENKSYGISWSSRKRIAEDFCEPFWRPAGAVLLQAKVPASAIIAKMYHGYDYFGEDEYLVDRRRLKANAVRVLKTFPQPTSGNKHRSGLPAQQRVMTNSEQFGWMMVRRGST